MQLTTIIVSYNTRHLLDDCLASLHAAEAAIGGGACVVVDNASRDSSADHLAQRHPEVQLIRLPHNVGFGRANNAALPHVHTPFVLLLNTDAFMTPESLRLSLDYMAAHPRCGVLGARLLNRDGSPQPSARRFPTPWNVFLLQAGLERWFRGTPRIDPSDWDADRPQECDWVPGCYYLIRKSVIDQVGLFDPLFFLYAEEVDLCRRVKNAGWQVHYFPDAHVVHLGGESAKAEGEVTASRQLDALSIESNLLYFRKHHGRGGLFAHVFLEGLAALLVGLRELARRSSLSRLATGLQRWRATLGLLRQTAFGTRPTR
ncbi:glycosyltransferase family 2 protein [Ideonella sp. YS5]|uniref:glycosyltransferase family 2 protein n=1 Tax=Ideonella sp. YS5 TaxID=3453714 RepID=UPI003EEBAFCC